MRNLECGELKAKYSSIETNYVNLLIKLISLEASFQFSLAIKQMK